MESVPQRRLFRFGLFEADARARELRKEGRMISLTGQPFDILIMLLERPGEVVLRTEIRDRLWADGTFVDFDHSPNTAINKVRDALGDSAANPRFIQTLARRGYRFTAPVEVVNLISSNGGKKAPSAPSDVPAAETPQLKDVSRPMVVRVLSGSHDLPPAPARLVRSLFLLLQVMYLCFYLISLARLHVVQEIIATIVAHPLWATVLLIVTAIVGIPIRLYLIAAAGFDAPGLREKFLWLFVVIFSLDELWALAPFLLAAQIGYGLALGLTAILLYVPFAERSLILMGAGRASRSESLES